MKMNSLKLFRNKGLLAVLLAASVLTACSDDDDDEDPAPPAPPIENEEEVITSVELIFTNDNDTNDVVTAKAIDPDGEGVLELTVQGSIQLDTNTTYTLTYEILNAVDSTDIEDIGEEIADEDDEHQIFYAFSNNAFADPLGDGNIDNFADDVNYNDFDDNNDPVGLNTTWETSGTALAGGEFRVRLMHQPDIKSSTTTAQDGEDDFDLTFVLDIQ